jgi:hypothetical protein
VNALDRHSEKRGVLADRLGRSAELVVGLFDGSCTKPTLASADRPAVGWFMSFKLASSSSSSGG